MPVAAKDWFEICHVSDGVSLLREKYVAHWLRCNIWFIQGRDRNLVIDSGMGLSPLTPMLLDLSELPRERLEGEWKQMEEIHSSDVEWSRHA